jgi:hypothetical protein
VGFELVIPASKWQQIHASDRTVTGIDKRHISYPEISFTGSSSKQGHVFNTPLYIVRYFTARWKQVLGLCSRLSIAIFFIVFSAYITGLTPGPSELFELRNCLLHELFIFLILALLRST